MVATFQEKIATLRLAQSKEQRKSTFLGWTRFFVFLLSIFFLYRALSLQEAVYFLWSFAAAATYSYLFSLHQKIKYQLDLKLAKSSNYEAEIDRLQYKFDSTRDGEEFKDEQQQLTRKTGIA